jgi:hypothetical protein
MASNDSNNVSGCTDDALLAQQEMIAALKITGDALAAPGGGSSAAAPKRGRPAGAGPAGPDGGEEEAAGGGGSVAGGAPSAAAASGGPGGGCGGGGGGGGEPSHARTAADFLQGSNNLEHLRRNPSKQVALQAAFGGVSAETAAALDSRHAFWSTQPVPRFADRAVRAHGPIEAPRTAADVRKKPIGLPAGYEWVTIDVHNDAQLEEMYALLCNNYVEDDEAMFRFAYPLPFLKWALTPPHAVAEWVVGVRATKSGRLIACITGVPAALEVYGRARPFCEINFLCVSKKLRSLRIAPSLIKEVTRRVNRCGVWHAAYTAGMVLPTPVASARYWHRSLNPRKLVDVRFCQLPPRVTMNKFLKEHALNMEPATGGLRPLAPGDVPSAALALNAYLARFALRPVMSEADAAHWLLPRAGVVDCWVRTKTVSRAEARAGAEAAVREMEARREEWLKDTGGEGGEGAGGGGGGGGAGGAGGGGADGAGDDAPPLLPPIDWRAVVERAAGAGNPAAPDVEVVTDLVSFYHLPSTVIGNAQHTHLYAAYLYYYVAGTVPLRQLLGDCLVLAKRAGIDVLNCLNIGENAEHIEALKFGPGDGNLQYYLFNVRGRAPDKCRAPLRRAASLPPPPPFPLSNTRSGAALKWSPSNWDLCSTRGRGWKQRKQKRCPLLRMYTPRPYFHPPARRLYCTHSASTKNPGNARSIFFARAMQMGCIRALVTPALTRKSHIMLQRCCVLSPVSRNIKNWPMSL